MVYHAVRSCDLSETMQPDVADEPLRLPLDEWHRSHGGRMVPFAGYMMPVQYEGIIAEHLWTRENAGLFDVSHMGQLVVSGPGGASEIAADALETLLPGDISALKPGRVRYSLLLAEDGGVLDDLMVAFSGKDYVLIANGATKWDDIAHLREHLPDEITLTHLDDAGLLALQGPKAVGVLQRLRLAPMDEAGKPLEELQFMQTGSYDWNGVQLGVSRTGYTGEDGFEISVPGDRIAALADALVAHDPVKPIGLGARDSLRLEAGLPLYGHDVTTETDPVTAGLGFAVSKRRRAEGGFPGDKRILSLLSQGAQQRRVGLLLEGRMAAREGASVLSEDRQVGRVTSGGFSPTLQRPIAMAYVESDLAAEGTPLTVEMRGKRLQAAVASMPFVPHRYHR